MSLDSLEGKVLAVGKIQTDLIFVSRGRDFVNKPFNRNKTGIIESVCFKGGLIAKISL